MKRLIGAVALVILAGACQKETGNVLGKAPKGEARTVLAVREGLTPLDVTLHGTMVEKCPTAGCWFHLMDRTGALKVDTKKAGFVITQVPLQAEVTVSGTIAYDGSEPFLEATGVRY